MCGDHKVLEIIAMISMGSPPHVRGPLSVLTLSLLISGITPACAGTTAYQPQAGGVYRDHPRMCGDHKHINGAWRTRGSPCMCGDHHHIIP